MDRLALTILVFALAQLVLLGTVRDNLQIASACATDAELRTALVAVGAEWANELPDGLDTDLGHGGIGRMAPRHSSLPWRAWCWPTRTC